jgi:hypothetical protein
MTKYLSERVPLAAILLLTLIGGAHAEPRLEARASSLGEFEGRRERSEEDHAQEPGRLALGVDLVVGFGKTPVVSPQLRAANLASQLGVSDARVTSESLLLAAGYAIAEGLEVGLRLPVALGQLGTPTGTRRSIAALGNLELEAAYETELSEAAKLVFSLGVALPTAQGSETADADLVAQSSQNAYDRFSLNHAAAASRGFEENALFEPDRLGVIPKLALEYRMSDVLVQPYIKLENLISTRSDVEHGYLGELVFGTFVAYAFAPALELGLRVWGNVAFAGGGESVGVLEPQLRAHVGVASLILGGIIPFAGSLTDPQFGGVRLAFVARL